MSLSANGWTELIIDFKAGLLAILSQDIFATMRFVDFDVYLFAIRQFIAVTMLCQYENFVNEREQGVLFILCPTKS